MRRDRGPGVDGAADMIGHLDDEDAEAGAGEVAGAGEPVVPAADHQDIVLAHAPRSLARALRPSGRDAARMPKFANALSTQ